MATRVLTGTNRSIKRLIATLRAASFARGLGGKVRRLQRQALTPIVKTLTNLLIPARPGGSSEGPTPDPIPNSAVKTLSANGTAP